MSEAEVSIVAFMQVLRAMPKLLLFLGIPCPLFLTSSAFLKTLNETVVMAPVRKPIPELGYFILSAINLSLSCCCCCSVTRSCLFVTLWTAARQAFLSFTISRSLLKLTFIESILPSSHFNLCGSFSCFQSFPASGSFPMSRLFT